MGPQAAPCLRYVVKKTGFTTQRCASATFHLFYALQYTIHWTLDTMSRPVRQPSEVCAFGPLFWVLTDQHTGQTSNKKRESREYFCFFVVSFTPQKVPSPQKIRRTHDKEKHVPFWRAKHCSSPINRHTRADTLALIHCSCHFTVRPPTRPPGPAGQLGGLT